MDNTKIARYILPEDGHPTTYFNKLIAEEMKEAVLAVPSLLEQRQLNNQTREETILNKDLYTNMDVSATDKNFYDYNLQYFKDYLFLHKQNIAVNPDKFDEISSHSDSLNISAEEYIYKYIMWLINEKEKECFQK